MIKIAPSILSADFSRLGEEVARLKDAGADLIHIDVMDGHFVPNLTFGPTIIKSIRPHSDLKFDVHLMITNPEQYIEAFIQSGADIITVHAESTVHLDRLIGQIKSYGINAGVALNPATPLSVIEYVLQNIDLILIMSVNPGFGGQKFISSSLNKISKLREMIDSRNLNIEIEVDGGITAENASIVSKAGAEILVAGSAVFNSNDMKTNISNLKL